MPSKELPSLWLTADAMAPMVALQGVAPLHLAASQGWGIACDLLLRYGGKVNVRGKRACFEGNPRHRIFM